MNSPKVLPLCGSSFYPETTLELKLTLQRSLTRVLTLLYRKSSLFLEHLF